MSRCRCVAVEYLGCQCAMADSATISVVGDGSGPDPFVAEVILDPSGANNIREVGGGLTVSGPRGIVADSGFVSTSQGPFDVGAPIAGLEVSANLIAGREYRVVWDSAGMVTSNPNESWSFEIREGVTSQQQRYVQGGGVDDSLMGGGQTIFRIPTAPGGVRTFYAYLARSTGNGLGTHVASGAARSSIWIEDVTPE